jgi:hypothetical protein
MDRKLIEIITRAKISVLIALCRSSVVSICDVFVANAVSLTIFIISPSQSSLNLAFFFL